MHGENETSASSQKLSELTHSVRELAGILSVMHDTGGVLCRLNALEKNLLAAIQEDRNASLERLAFRAERVAARVRRTALALRVLDASTS